MVNILQLLPNAKYLCLSLFLSNIIIRQLWMINDVRSTYKHFQIIPKIIILYHIITLSNFNAIYVKSIWRLEGNPMIFEIFEICIKLLQLHFQNEKKNTRTLVKVDGHFFTWGLRITSNMSLRIRMVLA